MKCLLKVDAKPERPHGFTLSPSPRPVGPEETSPLLQSAGRGRPAGCPPSRAWPTWKTLPSCPPQRAVKRRKLYFVAFLGRPHLKPVIW